MHYYLVEDINQEINIPKDSKVIALSPDAIYKLEKRSVDYILIEDFVKMYKLYGDDKSYLDSQLAWFREFDEYIKLLCEDAKKLNINFATLYFYNIKYLVDQLIISVRLIKAFIEVKKPNKITFISQVLGKDKLDRWHWFYFGESSLSRVIEPICEVFKIPLDKLQIYTAKPRAKRFITKNDFIATVKYLLPERLKKEIKYKIYNNRLNNTKRESYKGIILVIGNYGYVEDFCRDAIENGYKIVYFNEKELNVHSSDNIKINLSENKYAHKKDKLLEWVYSKCGINTYNIIKEKLDYIVRDTFSDTLVLIKALVKLYKIKKINYVVNGSIGTEISFAACEAARICKNVKSIGFFHGIDGFGTPFRYFMEFRNFDIYFASTKGEVEQIKKLDKKYNKDNKMIVREFSYIRDRLIKTNNNRVKIHKSTSNRKTILYIPIMRKIRPNLPVNGGIPTTMESYRWHRMLLNYFKRRQDNKFIWKAYLQPVFNYDPIEYSIKSLKLDNLIFCNNKLIEWFPKVDKVICDVPSTSYYQACFSGKPVLTFYNHNEMTIRPNLIDELGNSLHKFISNEDSINKIEKFLDSESESYVVKLSKLTRNNKSIIETLHKNNLKSEI